MMGQEIEAKLVRFPADVAGLRLAMRKFEFERGVRTSRTRVATRDAVRLRWMVVLAGIELEVEEQVGVRERHMVLVSAG